MDKFKGISNSINNPQKTTILGYTGIFGQLFTLLGNVKVGEFLPYLLTLTYGDILTIIFPVIVFIWAIIHDERK